MATTTYGKKVSIEATKSPQALEKKVFGLGYPLVSSAKGYLNKRSGTNLITGNLEQLLKTSRGERAMLPDFGTNLESYLFEQLDETLAGQIRDHVLETIALYAPNVEVLKFGVYETSELNYTGLPGFVIKLTVYIPDTQQTTTLGVTIG